MPATTRRGGGDGDEMDMEGGGAVGRKLTPLKYHGSWGYKAIKQLVKLHLRSLDGRHVMRNYARMLRVTSSLDAAISPNAMEKGVNGMLDRVPSLIGMLDRVPNLISQSSTGRSGAYPDDDGVSGSDPRAFARNFYDLALDAFHPATGISPNERLWFKTNLKYGMALIQELDGKMHSWAGRCTCPNATSTRCYRPSSRRSRATARRAAEVGCDA